MIGEAFGTRKRFLGVPTVSCAGWVGTIKHSQWLKGKKKEQNKRGALVLWLDMCNSEKGKINRTNNKNKPRITSEQLDDVVNRNFVYIRFGHE